MYYKTPIREGRIYFCDGSLAKIIRKNVPGHGTRSVEVESVFSKRRRFCLPWEIEEFNPLRYVVGVIACSITVLIVIAMVKFIGTSIYRINHPVIITTGAKEFKGAGISIFRVADHSGWEKPAPGLERVVNNSDKNRLIRCVWNYRGETTKWFKMFSPGEKYYMDVSGQHGFYVYDADRKTLLGYITPN